jgi:hypothetical protein
MPRRLKLLWISAALWANFARRGKLERAFKGRARSQCTAVFV